MSVPESFAGLPLARDGFPGRPGNPTFGDLPGRTRLPGRPGRPRQPWTSPEGIDIQPLYGPEHLEGLDALDTWPGLSPFLRGPYPTMYTTQPWTIRQYAGFSTAEESNAFYRRNLAAGQKGLSVAFDLATHRGYDSDHPRVRGDVGMAGVAIDSIYDARTLFDGIPLDEMSVSMTMNGAVLPVLALYIVAAEEQGVKPEQLAGTIQNDILKEFMVRNTYIYPPAPSMRIISDIFAFTAERMPRFNSISISGYHMQEAGATADLELAYTLADGVEYLRAGLDAGLDIDRFAPRLSFFWAIGMNFFMEVAKMRAARALWARLVREFEPAEPQVAQPAHALPDQRLVADRPGRLQQRRPHLHRGDGRDPGPHPVAAHQRARRGDRAADRLLGPDRPQHPAAAAAGVRDDRASSTRGPAPTTSSGSPTTSPSAPGPTSRRPRRPAAWRRRSSRASRRCGSRRRPPAPRRGSTPAPRRSSASTPTGSPRRTSSTCCASTTTTSTASRSPSSSGCAPSATTARSTRALEALTRAAESDPGRLEGNLLALAVDAARAKATVGEISDALEKVYGRHQAVIRTISGVYRDESGATATDPVAAGAWRAADEFEEDEGRRPRILVAKMGQDGHDRGQKVIVTAFADLGFDVDVGPLFSTPEEVAQQAVDADVHIVGVSSLAAGHLTLRARSCATALADLGRDDIMVVVGGVIPPDDVPTLLEMGAAAVFLPGTVIAESALDLLDEARRAARPRLMVERSRPVDVDALVDGRRGSGSGRPSRGRSRSWSRPGPTTGPPRASCSSRLGDRRRRPGRHLRRARASASRRSSRRSAPG